MKTQRLQLMICPDEAAAIDDWQFANRVRSRAEAIRRLVKLGLQAAREPEGWTYIAAKTEAHNG